MTDAERLIAAFHNLVAEAPTRIAPERDRELLALFGGQQGEQSATEGEANFFANLKTGAIEARFAALMSVWATAHACLDLAEEVRTARNAGKTKLVLDDHPVARRAYDLLEASKALIGEHTFSWHQGLPIPDFRAQPGTEAASINNVFLGATAWALLHEVAHLKLDHQVTSNTDQEKREEFEADDWAAAWVLEKTPSAPEQEFRTFCIAVALVWLQLVEEIRGRDHIHPPAFERLTRCSERFPYNNNSPALEMAADVLKVVFDPASTITADDAGDAYASIGIRLSRGAHMIERS